MIAIVPPAFIVMKKLIYEQRLTIFDLRRRVVSIIIS